MHPEMYDEDGMVINEELLSVKFIDEDYDDETLMHEVLQKVSNAKTKAEKKKLLLQYNTQALRSVLIINFDESVVSLLPPGEPPYRKNEAPDGTEHTVLEKEARLLHHFFKGGSSEAVEARADVYSDARRS